jgi:PAP_fibrillin
VSARLAARAALLAHLDRADGDGGLSEADFALLGERVAALTPLSAYPRPTEHAERLAGRWRTLFAHFGARHSAGKPRAHDSSLKIQSFNKLPDVPVRVTALEQLVAADGSHYDNIVHIATPGSALPGVIVTRGRWVAEPSQPQRLHVTFENIAVTPANGVDPAAFRAALGLDAQQPLSAELQVGKLHSDVVYLDDEYRINIGIQGGLYVLTRVSG